MFVILSFNIVVTFQELEEDCSYVLIGHGTADLVN